MTSAGPFDASNLLGSCILKGDGPVQTPRRPGPPPSPAEGQRREEHLARSTEAVRSRGERLLISSELPEVMRLSTRVLVIRDGRVVGDLPRERLAQDALLRLMAGMPAAWPESGSPPADSGRTS